MKNANLKGRKRSSMRSAPYFGQRPHLQGKHPKPFFCFSWNLNMALRRAFQGFQKPKRKKKEKLRIECLMDLINFDINQLLIYENQSKRQDQKKECVIQTLRTMKTKVEDVKKLARESNSLRKADGMLKTRDRLKCVSRSFRRHLIEHMADDEPAEPSRRVMCEMMKELDGLDAEIYRLCKCVEGKSEEESSVDLVKDTSCYDNGREQTKGDLPDICAEVMRPYDPLTDEDSKSIHLRYIPELDSFKVDMALNPRALRLPLMCPAMKRIMNKMSPSYLMDDIPWNLHCPKMADLTVRFAKNGFGNCVQTDSHESLPCKEVNQLKNVKLTSLHKPKINDIP